MEYSNELFHLTLKQRTAHELNPAKHMGGECEAKPLILIKLHSTTVCFSSSRRVCVAHLALPKCCAQSSAVPCHGERNGKWSEGHSGPQENDTKPYRATKIDVQGTSTRRRGCLQQ